MKKILITPQAFTTNSILMEEIKAFSNEFAFKFYIVEDKKVPIAVYLDKIKPEIILLGLEKIDSLVLKNNPQLEFISKYGVGIDNIDVHELEHSGVKLGWTPGVNKRSVSELALSFALGHSRNVFRSVELMKKGIWEKKGGSLLSNKRVGIIGLGHIGSDFASLLQPFGCTLLYYDIHDKSNFATQLSIKKVSYHELLAESDIISFHVPSTHLTQNMFNKESIQNTKDGAFIINTARGDIVELNAVIDAVESGKLSGYASDVFPNEPFNASQWKENSNFLFTPHIGGNALEAVLAMGRSSIEHIKNYLLEV